MLLSNKVDIILEKAMYEEELTSDEIKYLLLLSEKDDIAKMFRVARFLRYKYFKNKIFYYGFLYFSTFCRNNCNFCLYRKSNQIVQRYRKDKKEILEISEQLIASGVHLIDFTMGEDPYYLLNDENLEELMNLFKEIKTKFNIPLMVSPGVVSEKILDNFKIAGVNWYACYQETHNKKLYQKLRINQSFNERMEKKFYAKKIGLLIEEGILVGVGETVDDIINSFENMKILDADQVRVMSFIPQRNTPMENWISPQRIWELKIIAVMRLLFPDRLIPASLDVDGFSGLKDRLAAGANVITSIIPPRKGLKGVSNSELDIDDGKRSTDFITPFLMKHNLCPANKEEYEAWLLKRKRPGDF
ncbi:methylornithine synthase PylB [Carboxydothermus ferrireducens]|nr:methylornithine synthase PylB [Carboxydothermus ferrireducens]